MRSHGRIRRVLLAASLLIGLAPAVGWPQSAPEPELKAAFLLNFTKFAEWPDLPSGSPLVLCVFGDDRIASALSATVRGHSVAGHDLEVSTAMADTPMRSCHLLFVGASALRSGIPLLDSARPLPILTVSDSDRFCQRTGMIELFVEAGRMRFAINVDAVERAHLRLSSRLLGLAKIVRDKHAQ